MKKLMLFCIGCSLALSSTLANPIIIDSYKTEYSQLENSQLECSQDRDDLVPIIGPSKEEIIKKAMLQASFISAEIVNNYSASLSRYNFYTYFKPAFIEVREELNYPYNPGAIHPSDIKPDPKPGPNPFTNTDPGTGTGTMPFTTL